MKRFLFNAAYSAKLHNLHTYGKYDHFLYDKLVFGKIRKMLGGKVTSLVSGGAPISSEVQDFYKVVFGVPIGQGYGMTETFAKGCNTDYDDFESGH